jgi:cellobiose phosphorylase
MADRALDLAWIHNQVTLQQLGITEAEGQTYGQLAGALVFADPVRRAAPTVLAANRRGQGGLWSHGISGDLPIVLLRITDGEKGSLVEQVIHAHAYWRTKGLEVDLIILIEDSSTYRQAIHDQISNLVSSGIAAQLLDKPGGIFVRRLDQIPAEDHLLFQAVARVVLTDTRGSLTTQLEQRSHLEAQVHAFRPSRLRMDPVAVELPEADLHFDNGLGGFSSDGSEYVIRLPSESVTPAPWVNVMANPGFGTVVSEMGAGYTWSENAHEFRMTPWSNDPLLDPPGEVLYLRDEETGEYWSPTPQPATTPGA